jgi:hypothetical protein
MVSNLFNKNCPLTDKEKLKVILHGATVLLFIGIANIMKIHNMATR